MDKINTHFFDDKQKWYLTYGLYLPIICTFLSFILGKMKIKFIKNS